MKLEKPVKCAKCKTQKQSSATSCINCGKNRDVIICNCVKIEDIKVACCSKKG